MMNRKSKINTKIHFFSLKSTGKCFFFPKHVNLVKKISLISKRQRLLNINMKLLKYFIEEKDDWIDFSSFKDALNNSFFKEIIKK